MRKIKYSTTEIKYTRWEKRIAQRKILRIIYTKLQKVHTLFINENSSNE